MFAVPERLRAAMEARLGASPINARHLVIASGAEFDEVPLPAGITAVLSREDGTYRLSVASSLSERARNQVYAKALAHLLMHSHRVEEGQAWVGGDAEGVAAMLRVYPAASIGPDEEAAAASMAIEILVPTVSLREAFLYTQGNLAAMAKRFDVPESLIRAACVRRGFLDSRSTAAA